MIQKISIANSKPADDCACSFVGRAINQTSQSGLDELTGAHRARLNRRLNIHSVEPVVAELTSSFSKSDDFRVGRWIAVGASAIACHGEEFIVADYARANWHFATCLSFASCVQSLPHPAFS